jgi:hypothetical protein
MESLSRGIVSCDGAIKISETCYGEPLRAWRQLSRRAELILRVGAISRRPGGGAFFSSYDELVAHALGVPGDTPRDELVALLMSRYRHQRAVEWARYAAELGVALEKLSEIPDPPVRFPTLRNRSADRLFVLSISQTDALAAEVHRWIEDGGGASERPVWDSDRGELPAWSSGVRSLYAAIGYGLWNVIVEGAHSRRCKHCKEFFKARRHDQEYCPDNPACQQARNRENKRRSRADVTAQPRKPATAS